MPFCFTARSLKLSLLIGFIEVKGKGENFLDMILMEKKYPTTLFSSEDINMLKRMANYVHMTVGYAIIYAQAMGRAEATMKEMGG